MASKVLSDKGAFEWISEGSQGERDGLVGEGSSRQRDQMHRVPKGSIYEVLCAWHIWGTVKRPVGLRWGRHRGDDGRKRSEGQARAQQTFSVRGQVANTSGFVAKWFLLQRFTSAIVAQMHQK